MKALLKILISFLIIFTVFGCKKNKEIFSNIPSIELESITTTINNSENIIEVAINFTDGDGDFGLNENESTIEVDTILNVCTDSGLVAQVTKLTKSVNSLFAVIKEKQNSTYINAPITTTVKTDCEIRVDTITLNQTLPRVEPRGADKTLKGTIQTQFVIPSHYENGTKRKESIIEIYIEDRAKNKSNIITTPEFVF